eukprot:scaffold84138_cov48-Phaeocystis_antarctica.AAC.2
MVVSLAPSETGGRGQGKGLNAPAKPKSSERTSQEDLEPSEEAPRCERRRAMRGEERMHVTNVV